MLQFYSVSTFLVRLRIKIIASSKGFNSIEGQVHLMFCGRTLQKDSKSLSKTKIHTCPNSNFILFIHPFYPSFLTLFRFFSFLSIYSQQTSISIKSQHPSYPGFKKKQFFDVSNSMTSYFGLVNEHCSGLIL